MAPLQVVVPHRCSASIRAGHFRTSIRTSPPPYLRTTKRGAEVRSAEVAGTVRRHFKSVPPPLRRGERRNFKSVPLHLRQVQKSEIFNPYFRT
ncbi:hypothetical protein E2C01_077616 [Portunus trituberculatus]|uniref:Uncharacterized protein n=1 Tax=Portunus trituberculatus TaxID=210409 RepID=A0A5B7IMT4_PORTR|nr:hypothetical protein [Portunus trituberculatus]